MALGLVVPPVDGVANSTRHRQAGDGHRVAPPWPLLILDGKSRRRTGRRTLPLAVRRLIRTMSEANPLWGAPRIHGELLKLGIEVGQASVAKYMISATSAAIVDMAVVLEESHQPDRGR